MKKTLLTASLLCLLTQQAFASYFIVLRDGTKYRAKDRWTVINGKALITLENGTQFQIDPTLIDPAKTDTMNQSGLGDATLLATGQGSKAAPKQQESTLGTYKKLRGPSAAAAAAAAAHQVGSTAEPPRIGADVLVRFAPVYENVGIYGAKASPASGAAVHVELVADNEDQVFKAISATAYLLMKLPTVAGTPLERVELSMSTIKGGAAGKFNMTAEDAMALDSRQISLQKYYVDHVIF